MNAVDRFSSLHSESLRYTLAVGLVSAATAASYFSGEVLNFPYLVSFVGAVAISAFLGRGPGMIALVLATLASDFFFIPPIFSISFSPITWLAAAHYALAVLLILVGVRLPVRKGWDQKVRLILFMLFENFIPIQKPEREDGTQLVGRLDGNVDGEIYGWAMDVTQVSVSPKIAVYVDGRLVGETHAVHYRPDVDRHCFYFDLSRCSGPNPAARVEAKFLNGRSLPNSPLTVSIPVSCPARHSEAILFMHIAKTAGTAFREAMLENYKRSEVAYLYPDPPGFLNDNLGLLPLEQRATFRLVVGHFQYGIHRFLPQRWTYVTIVRDPVSRVISQYRYLVEKQSNGVGREKDSPAHLIELLARRENVTLDNYMVRCFSGVWENDFPPGHIGRDVYDIAIRNLKSSFSFVGHQERSMESYAALQQIFNWKPRSCLDVINRGDPSLTRGYESIRTAIEHFNSWDCLLHAEISRLFP